jgi:HK97 family phage prohead protease
MSAQNKTAKGGVEYRAFPLAEIRTEGDEKPRIVGHAAVFNQRTELWPGMFEVVSPGAFRKTIQEADVRALFNHDPNFVLGRNKAGTLILSEDERGLAIDANPPDTQTVRDLVLEPMRRGDINQMSFAFRVVRQTWQEDNEADTLTRVLEEVRLYDVSVVTYPAYPQTDASLRSLFAEDETGIDFFAVRMAMAKFDHKIDLSEEDRSLLHNAFEILKRYEPVPEVAAHHTEEPREEPPADAETLRRRIRLLQFRAR